jgi:hypothetical protein
MRRECECKKWHARSVQTHSISIWTQGEKINPLINALTAIHKYNEISSLSRGGGGGAPVKT